MKCKTWLSRKNKKIITKCHPLKFLPSLQSVKVIHVLVVKNFFDVSVCMHGSLKPFNGAMIQSVSYQYEIFVLILQYN